MPKQLDASSPRFRRFVKEFDDLLRRRSDEAAVLSEGRLLLQDLLDNDDWLPAAAARPHPKHYQQYALYRCPSGRFSVVSFVWGPGQSTPVHDHTVWGLVGVLRGAEVSRRYTIEPDGKSLARADSCVLTPGMIDMVSPSIGDIHSVENAYDDRVSISIHIYGADIGSVRRHVYDPATGMAKEFVSGYASGNG